MLLVEIADIFITIRKTWKNAFSEEQDFSLHAIGQKTEVHLIFRNCFVYQS